MPFKLEFILKMMVSFLVFSAISFCQSIDLQFEKYSISEGLSNSTVNKIIQDRYGFMWFGTQNGLNKFDGYSFTVYKNIPFDTLSLSDNWIQALIEAKDGSIWIGTHSGGLFKFDRNLEIFINYKNDKNNVSSISSNRIWDVFEDNEGKIWIGTSGGLDKYDPLTKNFYHYSLGGKDSITNYAVNSIIQDEKNNIWVATWGSGLFQLTKEGKVLKQYLFNVSNGKLKSSNKIKVVYEDRSGIIWLGTNGDGLIRFDKSNGSYKVFLNSASDPYSISYDYVLSIIEDQNGNLWIGTHNGGLNRFDRKENKFYHFKYSAENKYSLSNNWVPTIYEDKSRNIWVGTDRGINKFSSEGLIFQNLRHVENDNKSLSSDDVHSILEDSFGKIWIGTWKGGLNVLDNKTKNIKLYQQDIHNKNSLPDDIVLAIFEDKQKDIWIGTHNGLAKFNRNNDSFKSFRYDQKDSMSLGFNNISAICEDDENNLWLGTWGGGLYKMDKKKEKFKAYKVNPKDKFSITDMIITCLFMDSKQNLYIGTAAGGLNIYLKEEDKFANYQFNPKNTNSISSNNISSIKEDNLGNIWIGTLGGGLNKLKIGSDKFTHYTVKNGLPDNAIMSIQIDNSGSIWLSTAGGITSLNPVNNLIKNFDHRDGVGNTEFITASAKGKDGKLIFGGKSGITYFYPKNSVSEVSKPNLAILGFKIFNQPVKLKKDIILVDTVFMSFDDNAFSIDFAALGTSRPDKINYAYMLDGFDKDWIVSNNRRTAYYTHLNPGKYKFWVMASIDNNWFTRSKPFTIIIRPPFWSTWWFILFSISVLIFIIFLMYRYRLNQLIAIERLRTRIAADLHDEIASNLSSIAMFGKIIQDDKNVLQHLGETPIQMLDRIITLSKESVVSIREIIWAIDPKTETIYDLLVKLRDMIISHCRAKNISLNFDFANKDILPQQNLLPEQRRDIWMLLKEIMNNCVKHSNCKELNVITLYDGEKLRIIINDDGVGFDNTKSYTGKGLTTIKKRAELLNSQLEIESKIGIGTSYIINLKI